MFWGHLFIILYLLNTLDLKPARDPPLIKLNYDENSKIGAESGVKHVSFILTLLYSKLMSENNVYFDNCTSLCL